MIPFIKINITKGRVKYIRTDYIIEINEPVYSEKFLEKKPEYKEVKSLIRVKYQSKNINYPDNDYVVLDTMNFDSTDEPEKILDELLKLNEIFKS